MYIFRHVVFLEHTSFYFFSYDSHSSNQYELTNIDIFDLDNDIFSDYNIDNYKDDTCVTLDMYVPYVPTTT